MPIVKLVSPILNKSRLTCMRLVVFSNMACSIPNKMCCDYPLWGHLIVIVLVDDGLSVKSIAVHL